MFNFVSYIIHWYFSSLLIVLFLHSMRIIFLFSPPIFLSLHPPSFFPTLYLSSLFLFSVYFFLSVCLILCLCLFISCSFYPKPFVFFAFIDLCLISVARDQTSSFGITVLFPGKKGGGGGGGCSVKRINAALFQITRQTICFSFEKR